ncbi:MAG TPA: hypothetical protein VEK08_07825 [Planctomycetota bacterium]|nr:hypothetical protein [Planctomycetota bacterium]
MRLAAAELKRLQFRGASAPAVLCALLVLLAAAGVPLSQLCRVAEVTEARDNAPTQYRLVLAGAFAEVQPAQAASEEESKPADASPNGNEDQQKKDDAPRLLKLLAEHWESASRIQSFVSLVAQPLSPAASEPDGRAPPAEFVRVFDSVFDPPQPPARGPPGLS